jgi:membrane-associated phospholipid phosphatase
MVVDIIKLVQSISNPFFDMLFQLITMLGEDTFCILVTAVIYWCIDKDMGYKLGFVTLSSAVVNLGIKDFFKVPRPIGEPGIRSLRVHTAEGYSFPSGHTQNTATLWTFFMLRFRRRWLYAVGILIILLVGLSRLYLGVHTPMDVIGGMIIGAVWAAAWGYLYDISIIRKNNVAVVLTALTATIGMFLFKDANYYKAVGALTGLLLGYLVEPRFINFKVKSSLTMQVLKVSSGLGLVYALLSVLKRVLPETLIAGYVSYLLLLLWITIAIPFIFKHLSMDRA